MANGTIPDFGSDGYLPAGIWACTEPEATFRFGSSSPRRRRLVIRLRRWIELGRMVGAKRLLLDGSFVTAKVDPEDVDAVIDLPPMFSVMVDQGVVAALELEQMILTRRPEELFAAEDDSDWQAWCEYFTRTREADGRRKGILEIVL